MMVLFCIVTGKMTPGILHKYLVGSPIARTAIEKSIPSQEVARPETPHALQKKCLGAKYEDWGCGPFKRQILYAGTLPVLKDRCLARRVHAR